MPVETDVVEKRPPEPVGVVDTFLEKRFVGRQSVAAHLRRDVRLLDDPVVGSPRDGQIQLLHASSPPSRGYPTTEAAYFR
jgi:hypothetical protein